eukprot:UN03863
MILTHSIFFICTTYFSFDIHQNHILHFLILGMIETRDKRMKLLHMQNMTSFYILYLHFNISCVVLSFAINLSNQKIDEN